MHPSGHQEVAARLPDVRQRPQHFRFVPVEELDEAVAEWAGRLAKGATTSIAYMKKSMNAFIDWDRGLTLQTLIEKPVSDTEDAQEGKRSFMEKRKPESKGR